ncbi:protein of unknown function [Paraburkholderia kururiensis]
MLRRPVVSIAAHEGRSRYSAPAFFLLRFFSFIFGRCRALPAAVALRWDGARTDSRRL